MKRFLKIILIYAMVLFAFTTLVNHAYVQQRAESGAEKFEDVPYGIQISNFGSSHGEKGINYTDINTICFNFALGSQYPSYDVRIMKQYIDHMENGGVAFLPLSYFSLFGPPESEDPDFLSKNKRYYHFLPKKLIKEYDFSTKFYECYFPVLAISDETLFDSFSPQPVQNSQNLQTNATDAAKNALWRYQTHIEKHLDEAGNRVYNQEEISAVYQMIQLCKEKNIEPILITTPFLAEFPTTVRENDPDFYLDFYGIISEIQSNTGVRYYDYSSDNRFSSSYHLFRDSDHLNEEGARQFTNILIEETIGQ